MDQSKRLLQEQNMLPIGRGVELRITASTRFVVGFTSCIMGFHLPCGDGQPDSVVQKTAKSKTCTGAENTEIQGLRSIYRGIAAVRHSLITRDYVKNSHHKAGELFLPRKSPSLERK